MIHDGVVHSAVWDDVWPAFCRQFHTIRYDRRGFGRSPATTTWHSETDDLSAVLRRAGVTRANPYDVTHSDRILRPKPALPRLREIRAPTLVLVGDADIPDVHAHAGAIEAGIPGARRIVIRGVGHLMYLEKPDEFARTVLGFIEANPR
ncbi:MAG: alpha/beta fold hydrolase [Gemmatimonadaceae bacterium]